MNPAEKAYRKGNFWYKEGQLGWAKRQWRKAADAGHARAKDALAFTLYQEGKKGEAEQLLREAVAAGDVGAFTNLGIVLRNRGELGEAEQSWRTGAASGDTSSVICLWHFLSEQGREAEAEQWRPKAEEAEEALLGEEQRGRGARALHEGPGM